MSEEYPCDFCGDPESLPGHQEEISPFFCKSCWEARSNWEKGLPDADSPGTVIARLKTDIKKLEKENAELHMIRARIDEKLGCPPCILGKRFVFSERLDEANKKIEKLEEALREMREPIRLAEGIGASRDGLVDHINEILKEDE